MFEKLHHTFHYYIINFQNDIFTTCIKRKSYFFLSDTKINITVDYIDGNFEASVVNIITET